MISWEEEKEKLNLSEEEKQLITFEEELIRTVIEIRKSKKFSQSKLAQLCNVKQPAIARLEQSTHSPQLDSILKVLLPMGYTLKIVPISEIEE